jgi:hypothetical protein
MNHSECPFHSLRKESSRSQDDKTSISYHTKMGFGVEQSDKEIDGMSVKADYDGPTKTGYCL